MNVKKEIEFCSECGEAAVEEVEECHEPGYSVQYYCSRCGEWIRGSPQSSTVQIAKLNYQSETACADCSQDPARCTTTNDYGEKEQICRNCLKKRAKESGKE